MQLHLHRSHPLSRHHSSPLYKIQWTLLALFRTVSITSCRWVIQCQEISLSGSGLLGHLGSTGKWLMANNSIIIHTELSDTLLVNFSTRTTAPSSAFILLVTWLIHHAINHVLRKDWHKLQDFSVSSLFKHSCDCMLWSSCCWLPPCWIRHSRMGGDCRSSLHFTSLRTWWTNFPRVLFQVQQVSIPSV